MDKAVDNDFTHLARLGCSSVQLQPPTLEKRPVFLLTKADTVNDPDAQARRLGERLRLDDVVHVRASDCATALSS